MSVLKIEGFGSSNNTEPIATILELDGVLRRIEGGDVSTAIDDYGNLPTITQNIQLVTNDTLTINQNKVNFAAAVIEVDIPAYTEIYGINFHIPAGTTVTVKNSSGTVLNTLTQGDIPKTYTNTAIAISSDGPFAIHFARNIAITTIPFITLVYHSSAFTPPGNDAAGTGTCSAGGENLVYVYKTETESCAGFLGTQATGILVTYTI